MGEKRIGWATVPYTSFLQWLISWELTLQSIRPCSTPRPIEARTPRNSTASERGSVKWLKSDAAPALDRLKGHTQPSAAAATENKKQAPSSEIYMFHSRLPFASTCSALLILLAHLAVSSFVLGCRCWRSLGVADQASINSFCKLIHKYHYSCATMSCGCGCCSKCGCQATCTCNRNIWTLESRGDFSYTGMKTAADELDGQYNFNGDNEYSSQSDSSVADENGEIYAKEGTQRPGVEQQQVGSQWQLPSWDMRQ